MENERKCIICGNLAGYPIFRDESSRHYTVECSTCGDYITTKSMETEIKRISKEERKYLSELIKQKNVANIKSELSKLISELR
ncbi:MAG: hypothetical protein GQ534_02390 [Candidatus Delongbacteria bacterium]|nr:hypothetical protein [Candidatus Delongbacteria bacterium]